MSAHPAEPGLELTAADVTVVVPAGGAAPAWSRCAASLGRLDPPPGEIIVVLDGEGAAPLAGPAREIGARVIPLPQQGGPSRARNHGAGEASGEILLFLDSDVEVPEGLAAHAAALFRGPDAPAALIGSYDDSPGHPDFLSQYRNLLHHFVHQTGRDEASTFWSGCGAVGRSVFLEAGGFDEAYGEPSIEDIELGARIRKAGHRIRMIKDFQVKHLKQWRLANMLTTDLFRRAVPWTELMLAEGELVNDLNVKTRDRISVVLAFVALLALPAALLWLPALAVAAGALALVVAVNGSLFRFFRRRHGAFFMVRTIPFYWIYLLICGTGFSLGLLRHLLRRGPRKPP